MSFLRKEDTAKVGKLVGAIVVVFGCAAWRVVGAVAPPKPAAAPSETVPSGSSPSPSPAPSAGVASASTNGVPPDAAPTKADDALIQPNRPVLGSMVNPFRTIALPRAAPAPAIRTTVRPLPMPNGPLPPATALPTTVPPAATPVATEAMGRVTGIVGGTNATAVLEIGKDECVVRQGSRLPDGTEVVAIGTTTVTLRHDGKTRVLDVGN